jgi:hypothetical protein
MGVGRTTSKAESRSVATIRRMFVIYCIDIADLALGGSVAHYANQK